jgi:ABC-type nickel/cobalt efflux system permease component RcnA
MAMRRSLAAAVLAGSALLAVPVAAFAHPLGNFTINHFAGLRVTSEAVLLDVVIDRAEIPTVAERRRLDLDGDGALSDSEIEIGRGTACRSLAADLVLTADDSQLPVEPRGAGLSFPAGIGGLPTMRLVCQYEAPLPSLAAGRLEVSFADRSDAERIGWREMTVVGDGTTILDPPVGTRSLSARLTSYPSDLLTKPPDVSSVRFGVLAGGPAAPPFEAVDARPIDAPAPAPDDGDGAALAAAVPGGVTDELAAILADPAAGPAGIVVTIALALLLGAGHALSPGHGKTVMAAYLVGTRGSARHAVGLGLAVTASHTLGVLGLALVVVFASAAVSPEVLVPALGIASGIGFVAVGSWMLAGQLRARRHRRRHHYQHDDEDHHDARHDNDEHGHLDHSHAGIRHRHGPPTGAVVTWRGIVGLGLIGGLVPSVSALVLLLGSLAAGRPAYGVVLVVAFGLGMAVVLGGIGLVLVRARGLLDGRLRLGPGTSRRLAAALDGLPILAAAIVIAAGAYVTATAIWPAL